MTTGLLLVLLWIASGLTVVMILYKLRHIDVVKRDVYVSNACELNVLLVIIWPVLVLAFICGLLRGLPKLILVLADLAKAYWQAYRVKGNAN